MLPASTFSLEVVVIGGPEGRIARGGDGVVHDAAALGINRHQGLKVMAGLHRSHVPDQGVGTRVLGRHRTDKGHAARQGVSHHHVGEGDITHVVQFDLVLEIIANLDEFFVGGLANGQTAIKGDAVGIVVAPDMVFAAAIAAGVATEGVNRPHGTAGIVENSTRGRSTLT